MWILVYIVIVGSDPKAVNYAEYSTMQECFSGREELLVKTKNFDGYFKTGEQAICLQKP